MIMKFFAWLSRRNTPPARHSEVISEALSAIYTIIEDWDKQRDEIYEPRESAGLDISARFVSGYELLLFMQVLVPAVKSSSIVEFKFKKERIGTVAFGDWMTHEGNHINFEALLAELLKNIVGLQQGFHELELVDHEHLGYYRRNTVMVVRELNNLIDVLRELE